MAAKLNVPDADKLNMGIKSIASEVQHSCDKLKLLGGNDELYDQMQCIVKSLLAEGEAVGFATKMLNHEESLKNEQSFYLNKTGISLNTLPSNEQLEIAAKILQETGIDDYYSDCLFTKYMSMIEKCKKENEFIDNIDENINKLKLVIEQQDLKCELSNVPNKLFGYMDEPININPIENVQTVDNCEQIVELVKKIADIEKKLTDISKKTSELKSEKKKIYHELPPNMDKATLAVQIAEQTMKSVSKKLVEKLEKK